MRVIAIIWLIVALIFSVAATILYIEPASTIIDISSSSDGSFYVILPVGITFLICVAPLLLVFFIFNFIQGQKNKVPSDLTGKTGIVIQRELELQNAAIPYSIYLDGEKVKKVGTGKKVFIELVPGQYQLQIKATNKIGSAVVPFELTDQKILAFSTKADLGKSLTTLIPKGEMLFLVQIPYIKS